MKIKFLAILLCLVTVLSVFAGCQSKEIDEEELNQEQSVRTAVSINMWVVTENKVSAETEALVEAAFNQVTKARFTTYVDLVFATEAEYNKLLDEKFADIEQAKKDAEEEEKRKKEEARSLKAAGITTLPVTTADPAETTPEETVLNEYGVVELKYPAIKDNQLDIVVVLGRERLNELVSKSYLTDISEYVSDTGLSKALTDYINPVYMNFTKIGQSATSAGKTYGIPNNHVIGEYTYLLINKAMAAKYYVHENAVNDFADCLSLIEDIKNNETIAPVKAPFDDYLTYFWGSDIVADGFSVLASNYPLTAKQTGSIGASNSTNVQLPINDVFTTKHTDHLVRMLNFAQNGYFAKNDTEEFGVGVVKGDYELRFDYEDKYIVKVLKNPVATEDEIFESIFAVSSFSADVRRSMEVITLLNTTSELRNILQYGVEDVHYILNDDGKVERLNNDYMLDIEKTGNVFMAYPEENMSLKAWEYGKLQNTDSVIDITLGFRPYFEKIDPAIFAQLFELNAKFSDGIKACANADELRAYIPEAKKELLESPEYTAMREALLEQYKAWHTVFWPAQ